MCSGFILGSLVNRYTGSSISVDRWLNLVRFRPLGNVILFPATEGDNADSLSRTASWALEIVSPGGRMSFLTLRVLEFGTKINERG